MSPGPMKSNRTHCFSRFGVISNSALVSLFTNASLVLDGFAERQAPFHVLVRGGYIHAVSPRPLEHGDATAALQHACESERVSPGISGHVLKWSGRIARQGPIDVR